MKKVSIFGKLIKKLNEFLKKIKSFKVKEKKKSQKREDVFDEEPKVSNPYVLTVKNTKDIPQRPFFLAMLNLQMRKISVVTRELR